MLALQLPQHGEPVLVGQLDVHHHEVGHLLGHGSDGLGAGRGVLRLVPGILQQVGEEIPDLGLVIDDEDRSSGVGQSDASVRLARVESLGFPRLEGSHEYRRAVRIPYNPDL